MKKSELFWWVVIAGVVAAMAYGYHYHQKLVKGFCPAEGRYFGEQELVDAAIEKYLVLINSNVVQRTNFIEYSGVDAFRELNPDCCVLRLSTQSEGLGVTRREVREQSRRFKSAFFLGELKFVDQANPKAGFRRIKFNISTCGLF